MFRGASKLLRKTTIRTTLSGGAVAAVAAASLIVSDALAQPALLESPNIRPRYLSIYTTLQRGTTWWRIPGKLFHDRKVALGEDPSTLVLEVFEKHCLEAFRRGRAKTLAIPKSVLDMRLPLRPGGHRQALLGKVFCVPNAADDDKIFDKMRGLPAVFDDLGLYAPRDPYACGGAYSGGPRAHAGVEAALLGDFNRPDGSHVPPMHCWASAQVGDYDVVLKGVEAALHRYGRPFTRSPVVADGDWLRQAAFDVTFDDATVTVLVSGALRTDIPTGPKVEINVLPVRFTP